MLSQLVIGFSKACAAQQLPQLLAAAAVVGTSGGGSFAVAIGSPVELRVSRVGHAGFHCSSTAGATASSSVANYEDPTGESVESIRERVFGTYVGDGKRNGRKTLKKKLYGDMQAAYYPEDIKDPLLYDPEWEEQQERLDNLRRRGKGPPAKKSS